MSKSKNPRTATGRNLEFKLAMMDIGRSSATTPRQPKTPRKQATRAGQKRAALKEW